MCEKHRASPVSQSASPYTQLASSRSVWCVHRKACETQAHALTHSRQHAHIYAKQPPLSYPVLGLLPLLQQRLQPAIIAAFVVAGTMFLPITNRSANNDVCLPKRFFCMCVFRLRFIMMGKKETTLNAIESSLVYTYSTKLCWCCYLSNYLREREF